MAPPTLGEPTSRRQTVQDYIVRFWDGNNLMATEVIEATNALEALERVLINRDLHSGAYNAEVESILSGYTIKFEVNI